MFNRLITAVALTFSLVGASVAAPVTINFATQPTNTTYLNDGLLLGSSTNSYQIGGCGTDSVGCLGSVGFTGWLDFSFVAPGTSTPAATDFVELTMCRGCDNRGSSAFFFDTTGTQLNVISLNGSGSVANHTFQYSAANIGRVRVFLGFDAVESITFGQPTAGTVPEPASLALVGVALAAAAGLRRRRAV